MTKEQLKNGYKYEKKVFSILKNNGLLIYPLCNGDYETAPGLFENNTFYRAPDFFAWLDTKFFFIEVKSQAPLFYNQIYEFTINKKQFDNYIDLKKRLNCGFKIVFCDIENGGFFYADLEKYSRFWDGKSPSGAEVREPCYIWNKIELPQIYEPRKNELKEFL